MLLKKAIFAQYLQIVNSKITILQQALSDLKESGSNETKSTAGDKHETALAMLQIEQANVRGQLQDAHAQWALLEKIKNIINCSSVIFGSVVCTSKGYFYISTALGKVTIEDKTIMAISAQSPLGAKFMGLVVGQKANVNGNEYLVEEII